MQITRPRASSEPSSSRQETFDVNNPKSYPKVPTHPLPSSHSGTQQKEEGNFQGEKIASASSEIIFDSREGKTGAEDVRQPEARRKPNLSILKAISIFRREPTHGRT